MVAAQLLLESPLYPLLTGPSAVLRMEISDQGGRRRAQGLGGGPGHSAALPAHLPVCILLSSHKTHSISITSSPQGVSAPLSRTVVHTVVRAESLLMAGNEGAPPRKSEGRAFFSFNAPPPSHGTMP